MTKKIFPAGWNEARVKSVLEHYESQAEDEAVAEDEATLEEPRQIKSNQKGQCRLICRVKDD